MNGDSPAFPCTALGTGMTQRQYYAAHAIIGLLAFPLTSVADPQHRIQSIPELARQAFEFADAMIEAQKRKEEDDFTAVRRLAGQPETP